MSDEILQGGISNSANKEGDFIMVTREIIRVLSDRRIVSLTTFEKSICLILLEKTIGQHCERRSVTASEFMKATGISRATVFESLRTLESKQVIKTEKKKGVRSVLYCLNVEFFGRIYPGKIENVYYLDKFKVREVRHSKSGKSDFKSPSSPTGNHPKPAVVANSGNPNISSNISSNISQRELIQFIESRSINTKKRWISVINHVVENFPDDQGALWLAIDLIHRTNKDLLDRPIHSSILRLFETSEWGIMKEVMMHKIRLQREAQDKEKKKEENKRLVEETHRQLANAEFNVESIDPRWRKYAEKGSSA